MKPRIRKAYGAWWCGPLDGRDFYLWATCAQTPLEAFRLWQRWQA